MKTLFNKKFMEHNPDKFGEGLKNNGSVEDLVREIKSIRDKKG